MSLRHSAKKELLHPSSSRTSPWERLEKIAVRQQVLVQQLNGSPGVESEIVAVR